MAAIMIAAVRTTAECVGYRLQFQLQIFQLTITATVLAVRLMPGDMNTEPPAI